MNALLNSIIQLIFVKIGVSMKTMASEAVYRKALVLTSSAKGTTSTGQLVNIMSSDTAIVRIIIPLLMSSCKLLLWLFPFLS